MTAPARVQPDRRRLTDATRPATPPRYDDLPDLCTPDDARQFLQVGKNTIYDLIKSGELRSIRFGKLIRIPKTALLANGHGHDRG